MTMHLRPYQQRIVDECREHIRAGRKRILVQLPTGGGKTVIAAFVTHGAVMRGMSTWFLCHRDFLLEQTDGTFKGMNLDPAIVSAKHKQRWQPLKPVQLCGVQSVKARQDKLRRPRIAIWDECHHIAAKTYSDIHEWLGPQCIHIGLSATPERLDGRGLDKFFDVMVLGPSVEELMQAGSLAQYRAFAPSTPDLSGVRKVHGDFNLGDLEEEVDTPHIVGDIVRSYQERGQGRRAVYFAVTVAHSQHIADAFCAAGIPAMHLDANSDAPTRKRAALAFARGELQVLCNVDLFGEGYDLSAQAGMPVTIDVVGLARPTQSLGMYMQQVGRALRPKADGSRAIILDHAGNVMRHGLPDEAREWKLTGRDKKKAAERSPWMCDGCLAMNAPEMQACQVCGEPRSHAGKAREIDHRDGELVELDRAAVKAAREAEKARRAKELAIKVKGARTLQDFQAIGREMGYKPGWAQRRYEVTASYRDRSRWAS